MKKSIVLKEERSEFIANLETIQELATKENRDLLGDENTEVDSLLSKIDDVDALIERAEKVEAQLKRSASLSGSTVQNSIPANETSSWSLFKAVNEIRSGGQLTGLEKELHQEAEGEARKGLQGIGIPSFMTEKRAMTLEMLQQTQFFQLQVDQQLHGQQKLQQQQMVVQISEKLH